MPLKRTLFLLLILLLPADGTDFLRLTFRGLSVSLLDLLLVAVLYLDFLDGTLIGFQAPRFSLRLGWLAVAAATLSAVSLLYIPPFRMSSDIKVTLNLLQLAVTTYLAARVFRTYERLRPALLALAVSASAVALATVGKGFGLEIPGDVRTTARAFGPLTLGVSGLTQIPGPISLVLLAAFPVAALPGVIRSTGLRASIALLLALAAIVTFSRSLWLALLVEVMFIAGTAVFAGVRRSRRLAAGVGLAALTAFLAAAGPRLFELLVALRPTTVSGRLTGFANALELATTTPVAFLFGAGKGNYRLWTGTSTVPHNAILDLLVAKGVLTVIVFIALQLWLMARLARRLRSADPSTAELARLFLTCLVGLLAFGLASPTMTSLVLWTMIALAAACVSISETTP